MKAFALSFATEMLHYCSWNIRVVSARADQEPPHTKQEKLLPALLRSVHQGVEERQFLHNATGSALRHICMFSAPVLNRDWTASCHAKSSVALVALVPKRFMMK